MKIFCSAILLILLAASFAAEAPKPDKGNATDNGKTDKGKATIDELATRENILRTYFPSTLMTFVSWISFLVAQDNVTGRLALLLTCSLILINLLNAVSEKELSPKTHEALEIYVIYCIAQVVLALMEFTLIIYKTSAVEKLRRKWQIKVEEKISGAFKTLANIESETSNSKDTITDTVDSAKQEGRCRKISNWFLKYFDTSYIDICSIIIFPLMFVVFNIVYWVSYA